MAGYTTGSQELIKAGQDMMNSNQQLQGNLSKLASEVEGIAGSWAGDAHTAFQQLMESFQTDAKNLNTNLEKIAEAIAGSAQAYQRQEEESNQSISAITSALGGI